MIELKKFVERVVRPVPTADVWRKLRMREELYAHLVEAYQSERSATDDDAEAIRRAIARMGEPDALTAELVSTVSWMDRHCHGISGWLLPKSGDTIPALAKQITWLMTKVMAVVMLLPFMVNARDIVAWTPNGQITVRLTLALLGCFAVGAILLVPVAELLVRRIVGRPGWRAMIGAALLMAAEAFLVALSLGIFLHVAAAWDLSEARAALWSLLPASLAVSALAAGACVATAIERRRTAPWLELELDGA